jgi:hypothetical protein
VGTLTVERARLAARIAGGPGTAAERLLPDWARRESPAAAAAAAAGGGADDLSIHDMQRTLLALSVAAAGGGPAGGGGGPGSPGGPAGAGGPGAAAGGPAAAEAAEARRLRAERDAAALLRAIRLGRLAFEHVQVGPRCTR